MSGKSNNIEQCVIAFLRDALAQRYTLSNIRRYEGFNGLSDDEVEALRAFGLRYIYPDWEGHRFQQVAFDKLTALLDHPGRLKPLTAVALKSMWRLGRQLPRAIDAGKQVIEAFAATRALEGRVIDHVKRLQRDGEPPSEELIIKGLCCVTEEEFEAYVETMVTLFRLLAHRSLLAGGASVLADIAAAMEKRPRSFDDDECAGVRYAVEVMNEGIALFDSLDEAAVEAAVGAAPLVERDWFHRIMMREES